MRLFSPNPRQADRGSSHQDHKSKFRTAAKVADWFGFRLILLLTVCLVTFAVLQPLIWSEVLDRNPPGFSSDFAGLTAILVTIMSLALAGFGLVTYQLIERRASESLKQQAQEMEDNFRARAALANARILVSISYQAYLSYDKLWSERLYSNNALKNDEVLRTFLDSAIEIAGKALGTCEEVPQRLRERSECARERVKCKSNYTYFLATKMDPSDKKRVLEMAQELDQDGVETDVPKCETVAWSYLRYSEPGHPLWAKGLQRLTSVMSSETLPDSYKHILKKRYMGVFKGQGGAGLEAALNGGKLAIAS